MKIIKKIKISSLLFYFILSLFFMETILRISTTGGFFSSGLIFSLIFSISLGIVLYIICTLFESKVNYILSYSLLGFLSLIFCSQLIYYKFFKTFYSFYSAGNAGQIFQFWKDILILIVKNLAPILFIFLPVILIIVVGKELLHFKKINKHLRLTLVSCILLSHLTGLFSVYIGGRGQYSPYDLYFQNDYPILSVKKLGLITTIRLDMQRTILGWSPILEASTKTSPDTPVINNEIQEEEKKIEYNTLDIDFEKLIANEKDDVIKDMHKYYKNVPPTAKNKYTGKYKGFNLILITAEGFSPYAVRKDVTPTLYKMVHDGFYFKNFYNPVWGVSTSDGEYVACTGLIPKGGVWSFYKSGSIQMPLVMGNQLKKLGYKTVAYHNHTYTYYKRHISHPNMGYDYKGVGNGLDVKKTWPESDLEMMEKTVPEYINSQPFHAYYMTVSGHMRYTFYGNSMSSKNKKYVDDLPYSEPCKAYIACQIEFDKAMEYLLNQLEEAGIAENTLIAVSADHYPYGLEEKEIDELAGHQVEKNFELYKSTFILYSKGMEPVIIDRPCSSLDIIPTLSNLLGLEYDSRLLMGRDIFSDSEPLVIFSNRSFITDKGRYNSKTGEFVLNRGESVEEGYRKMISGIIKNKFYYSAKILETDYYKKVLKTP